MIWYIIAGVGMLALVSQGDPAAGVLNERSDARALVCERITVDEAERRRPGAVREASPRGDWFERSVMICTGRVLDPELRAPQDEALLQSMDERAKGLAQSAESLRPDLGERTWLVEANTANPEVAAKLTFATKNALMAQGVAVSDRSPTLSFRDIDVLSRMPPEEAYPAACVRYVANGSLHEGDALLMVMSLDARATSLHGGLCSDGAWTWLP